jgi:hypothetical protein
MSETKPEPKPEPDPKPKPEPDTRSAIQKLADRFR